MSVKSENLEDFGSYLTNIYNEMLDSKEVYEGKIREERINGNIESLVVQLDIVRKCVNKCVEGK